MARRRRKEPKYNEAFFRGMGGPGPTAVGTIMVVLILVGIYLAFSKHVPFTSPGYELKAEFENSANVALKSPVRIAGVNVGQVTGVDRDGRNSVVTFTVGDEGRPIHDDASAQIRPRIFLEGNFFVDLEPGSPSVPEMSNGDEIPITRTATAVQLDEILTSLQSPERENLQKLLAGFGNGLTYRPTAAEDLTQDPDVQGLTAGEAINKSFTYGGEAGRGSAVVNEALLGEPGQHDLAKLLAGLNRVSLQLVPRETQLQDLITNFNTTSAAFAAQSSNLSETIRLLSPTLATAKRSLVDLNAALPALRGYSIAIRPGIAELPATIRAGLPWLAQATPLLSRRELGGIASLLERGTPGLADATRQTLGLLPQLTDFNRCVSHNLVPAGNVVLQDRFGSSDFTTGQPNYREFFYNAAGGAGVTEDFDGNGIYLRFQPGGGPVKVKSNNPNGGLNADVLYGNNIAPPLGTRPQLTGVPPLKPDVPCYKNAVPNLNGPAAAAGPPNPVAYP